MIRAPRSAAVQRILYLDKKNNQTTYNQLGSNLQGVIEGDGNIYTPGLNVKEAPKIEIVFEIRDSELF